MLIHHVEGVPIVLFSNQPFRPQQISVHHDLWWQLRGGHS